MSPSPHLELATTIAPPLLFLAKPNPSTLPPTMECDDVERCCCCGCFSKEDAFCKRRSCNRSLRRSFLLLHSSFSCRCSTCVPVPPAAGDRFRAAVAGASALLFLRSSRKERRGTGTRGEDGDQPVDFEEESGRGRCRSAVPSNRAESLETCGPIREVLFLTVLLLELLLGHTFSSSLAKFNVFSIFSRLMGPARRPRRPGLSLQAAREAEHWTALDADCATGTPFRSTLALTAACLVVEPPRLGERAMVRVTTGSSQNLAAPFHQLLDDFF